MSGSLVRGRRLRLTAEPVVRQGGSRTAVLAGRRAESKNLRIRTIKARVPLDPGKVHLWLWAASRPGTQRRPGRRDGLREFLAELFGVRPETIPLVRTDLGKPYLPACWGPRARLSFSHSRGVAAVAVATGREVGVDIEAVRPIAGAADIARRHLSVGDAETVLAETGSERERAFIHAWVAAEALAKAFGTGVWGFGSVRDAYVRGSHGAGGRRAVDGVGREWRVIDVPGSSDHFAAVAAEGDDWALQLERPLGR